MKYGYTCPYCGIHMDSISTKECPLCGKEVFPGAGTGEQRCVLIFGEQNAGKYSVMLSIVVYLQSHGGRLVTDNGQLQQDLESYRQGDSLSKCTCKQRSATLEFREHEAVRFLTLVYIPHNERVPSDRFCSASAYVLCWDLQRDWDKLLFYEEKKTLSLSLNRESAQRTESLSLNRESAQRTDFNRFFNAIGKKYQKPPTTPSHVMANLCTNFELLMGHDKPAPVLLLYNKCDTLFEENWRIPLPRPNNTLQPMLFGEQYACTNRIKFPKLYSLSQELVNSIPENCFYAQMRFAPYGSTACCNSNDREALRVWKEKTEAVELFFRLLVYEAEYPASYLNSTQQAKLGAAIKKYTTPHPSLPNYLKNAIADAASSILKRLGTSSFDKAWLDQIRQAHQQACRYARCAKLRLNKATTTSVPQPKNIDLLANWLLYVTGIREVDLTTVLPAESKPAGSYRIKGPEYRAYLPEEQFFQQPRTSIQMRQIMKKWKQIRNEAAVRKYLFEKTGGLTEEYITSKNAISRWKLIRKTHSQTGSAHSQSVKTGEKR